MSPTPPRRARRHVRFALAAAVFLPGLDASATDGMSTSVSGGFRSCAREAVPEMTEPAKVAAKETPAPAPTVAPVIETPTPVVKTSGQLLREWLAAHMPQGGEIVDDGPAVEVIHTAKKGDTVKALAAAYVDLTTLYSEGELVSAILKANPSAHLGTLVEGAKIRIPRVVTEAPKSGDEARLGWPKEDGGALRGLYANATMAGHSSFPGLLDKMAAHGMNALVIDAKDVTGLFTYPSKVPLAIAVDANKRATITSFERLVRAAHARNIRVVARVTCFRDEYLGPKRHAFAVQKKGGGAHVAPSKIVDWLDPANPDVQQYLFDVVDEVVAAGVDEVQLDYVRYPTEGIWDADFKLKERNLTTRGVITGFVEKMHEHTKSHGVALSLDVFGVVAWRDARDMDATGQDVRMLAPHIEALSPMVYPSHFATGFNGYEKPGDHADVVAIGTKKALEEVKAVGANVVIRSWVQAFPWHTTSFGSQYIADQIAEAKKGGGVGWLAWNSGGEYGATFAAVPVAQVKKPLVASK